MARKARKRLRLNKPGSALIMTIVLTVLLSIVAVMFVLVARMDRAATSNIADNRMLDSAAKTIVNIISKELVIDTPGVTAGQEYYDYPDANNPWLASLQPYNDGSSYNWHQISDVTGYLKDKSFPVEDVDVKPVGLSTTKVYVEDYPVIRVDSDGRFLKPNGSLATDGVSADADGDGIADSKWIELENLRSSNGKRIYAAIRVIDNGSMININTAHSFDANSSQQDRIDGSTQLQVNLKGLLRGTDTIKKLHKARCGGEDPNNWNGFSRNVIWQYGIPAGGYLPFGISDELELRYRYCIDSKSESRFEDKLPNTAEGAGERNFGHLYDGKNVDWQIGDWKIRITDPNDPNADRRHILTTYNLDRIIDPYGRKMINVNNADVNDLNSIIRECFYDAGMNHSDARKAAAQIAVNMKDYRDVDSNVTTIKVDNVDYYGFERPCIYISELASRQVTDSNIPVKVYRSYAVELYKPYSEDNEPNGWKLINDSMPTTPYDINWSGTKQFYVIKWENSNAPLSVDSNANVRTIDNSASTTIFGTGNTVLLTRGVGGNNVKVDSKIIVPAWPVTDGNCSIQRDITPHKCIRRLWGPFNSSPTLGSVNTFISPDPNIIQAHPKNNLFTNIGEIGMVFRRDAYEENGIPIGPTDTEAGVFVDLSNPDFQQLFKYLTVIHHPTDNAEKRIKGRININTAPWYVISQLPWVSHRKGGYSDAALARAIVVYRDRTKITGGPDYSDRLHPGIGTIGQLCNVTRGSLDYGIDYYSRDNQDQPGFPDLDEPSGDGAKDDFEERNLIFARISDLVTVRSDMFTAYILVRVGTNGPQKRYMAILDRSGVSNSGDKAYVTAFQTVPEAR